MKRTQADNPLLNDLLVIAVPFRIKDLHDKGGPDIQDWQLATDFADVLACQGDNLLFRSQKKGQTAKLFNTLACTLAVCAFAPGGIKFAGEHYIASH